jgi:uncharacterized protein
MTLIDAGPLIALIDARDKKHHQACLVAFQSLKTAPLTTWPCVAEAIYLLGQMSGWPGQKLLLGLLKSDAVRIHGITTSELARIDQLMEQYQNVPMDLADASLVSLAELLDVRQILTLDNDFFIYKVNGKDPFDVIKP